MNKKKQALECIPDSNDYNKFPCTPFVQEVNGKLAVNATEGQILLSVYDDELVKEYDPQESPACDRVYKSLDLDNGIKVTVSIEEIEHALQNVKKNVVVETDKDCDECGCRGVVDWKYEDLNGNLHVKEDECPVCHGTGSIHEKLVERYDSKTVIQIGDCYFLAKMLDKVVDILKLLSVKSIDCTTLDYRFISHNNDFSLVVMGVYPSTVQEEKFKIIKL